MKANGLVLFGTLLCLAVVPLGAGCSGLPERAAKVYTDWPFDAAEAKRRQDETAKALGVPVQKTVDLGGGVKLRLVLIPAGEFLMGSPDTEEQREDNESRHRVRITKPFYIGKYEVFQEQWERVRSPNRSQFNGAMNPADNVSWHDCKAFLRKLNARVSGEGTFALPTEAEWEYACRAGTATPFHTGETISTDQANYDGNVTYGSGRKGVYRKKTVRVGRFAPNAFALYGMHGNVLEWCEDRYAGDYYEHSPKDDPKGPRRGDFCLVRDGAWIFPKGGECRVLRGGTWLLSPTHCRSASRGRGTPSCRFPAFGCRVILRDF